MNMIEVQDKLKNLSQDQLIREMQMPSGVAPQFLVLSEITRRQRMQNEMMSKGQQAPQSSVAEDAVAAAGMPQAGLGQMAQALAPQTDMTQNTGIGALPQAAQAPQRMAEGGRVGATSYPSPPLAFLRDPAIQAMASRMGVRPGELWRQMSEQVRAQQEMRLANQGTQPAGAVTRDDYLDQITAEVGVNPSYDPVAAEMGTRPGFIMPSQDDLNRRFVDEITPWNPGFGAPTFEAAPRVPGAMMAPPPANVALPVDLDLVGDTLPQVALPYREVLTQLDARSLPTGGLPMPGPTPLDILDAQTLANIPAMLAPLPPGMVQEPPLLGGSPGMMDSPEARMAMREDLEDIKDRSMGPVPGADEQGWLAGLWDSAASAVAGGFQGMADDFAGREDDAPEVVPPNSDETPAATIDPVVAALTGGPDGGGTGGTGGVPSAGPMSSYEQELVDAIKRADKRAEQDKWLSLAQAGLALMASKEPTLGGAIGEAGLVGLGAFQQSRNSNEEARLKLMEAQFGAQMARQQMALRGRSAGSSVGSGAYGGFRSLDQAFDNGLKMSEFLGEQLAAMTTPEGVPLPAYQEEYERLLAQKQIIDRNLGAIFGVMGGGGGPTFDADVTQ